jgi:hypothetical protein
MGSAAREAVILNYAFGHGEHGTRYWGRQLCTHGKVQAFDPIQDDVQR